MHIGIDGNLLCGKKTGMGTVVFNILKYWKADANTKITVFSPEPLDEAFQKLIELNGIKVKTCGRVNYFKWEQIVLPSNVKIENVDILWCPYNTAPIKVSCPVVVTVHDLIYMTATLKSSPSMYKKAGILYRRNIVPLAVRKAKRIITISQFAKREICDYFPLAEDKIEVVYNSADINVKGLEKQEQKRFFEENNICTPYILGFGSLESRKNSMGLIRAYCQMSDDIKKKYQLVLFGFRGYEKSEEFKYLKENTINNVVVLEYVSEEEKNTLYRNSKMFVFPTFSEGFGIPILEAFANSTPVITSNVTAIPEVAGNAAILINPTKINEICEAIERIIKEDNLAQGLVKKGKLQLQKFDWRRTSKEVMEIIQSVNS